MLELFSRPATRIVAIDQSVIIALDPPRAAFPDHVQAAVTRDPEQPGAPRRTVLEAIEIPEGLQERLLPHLLGQLAVAQHANAEPEHGVTVRAHQLDDRSAAIAR